MHAPSGHVAEPAVRALLTAGTLAGDTPCSPDGANGRPALWSIGPAMAGPPGHRAGRRVTINVQSLAARGPRLNAAPLPRASAAG